MKKFVSLLLGIMLSLGVVSNVVACQDVPDSGSSEDPNSSSSTPIIPDDPVYSVASVGLPTSIAQYNANSGEQDNEEIEFFILKNSYKVGDDNAFKFKPDVTFVNDELELVTIENWDYKYSVEVRSGDAYVAEEGLLDGPSENFNFDFSAAAVGKTVRLTVKPAILTAEQEANAKFAASFEFDVVDGYNVYNDYELSYMSNVCEVRNITAITGKNDDAGQISNQFGWKAYREAHGLTLNPVDVKALIFHNDISLDASSVPSSLIWTAEEVQGKANAKYLVGTLKDEVASGIYYRVLTENDKFDIYGNYFTLDASAFPVTKLMTEASYTTKVSYDENGKMISSNIQSHSSLFRVEGNDSAGLNKFESSASLFDLNLIGNSPKTEDKEVQGGLIFLKTEKTAYTLSNVNSRRFFITAMCQTIGSKASFINMKCYDSFNSPLYNWGCPEMILDNCIVKNAGGPAILCDAYMSGSTPVHPTIIATNCEFDNLLEGSEAWFSMALGDAAAMMIPGIKSLNTIPETISASVPQLNAALGTNLKARSFLKTVDFGDGKEHEMFNVYCVVRDQENDVAKADGMKAYVSINGEVLDYGAGAAHHGKPVADATHSATLVGTLAQAAQLGKDVAMGTAAPVLETTGLGLAYYNGSTAVFPLGTDQMSTYQEYVKFLSGNTLNMYYNTGAANGTLGIMFQYFEA